MTRNEFIGYLQFVYNAEITPGSQKNTWRCNKLSEDQEKELFRNRTMEEIGWYAAWVENKSRTDVARSVSKDILKAAKKEKENLWLYDEGENSRVNHDLSGEPVCPACKSENIKWKSKGQVGGHGDCGDNWFIVCTDCGLAVSNTKASWIYWENKDNILRTWRQIPR